MQVADLMRRDVVTIEDHRTCHDAIDRMGRERVRHLPVVDRSGALVGIVTDRDVRHWLFAPDVFRRVGRVPAATLLREALVRDVMSTPALSIGSAVDVAEAVNRMRASKVGSLVVVEDGQVVGILTEIDVLRHLIATSDSSAAPELDVVVSYP
jgi:acetoin utilization protein AcuB